MRTGEFYRKFRVEQDCKDYLRAKRESAGVICKKCFSERHFWLKGKESWQCIDCSFRTSLRSGTVMQDSNLKFMIWFECIHLMTVTKKGMSALEMQRQLGLKRYEPVWYMMQKIRAVMANINSNETLRGEVEIDDAFFNADNDEEDLNNRKRGRGSQKKQPVVLVVESKSSGKSKGSVGKILSFAVDRLDGATIQELEDCHLASVAAYKTDGYSIYQRLDQRKHRRMIVPPKLAGQLLPWVHTAIGNFKRVFIGIYHHMNKNYLQDYLDELTFRFNYRYSNQRFKIVFDEAIMPMW